MNTLYYFLHREDVRKNKENFIIFIRYILIHQTYYYYEINYS